MVAALTTDNTSTIAVRKELLSKALSEFNSDTKNEKVVQAVESLCMLNPTKNAASNSDLMYGEFTATGYNFQGTQLGPDGWECTLGRLAFNLFEPKNLPVTIVKTENILEKRPDLGDSKMAYTIRTRFRSRTPENVVEGIICNNGICWPDEKNPERLGILFTDGSLQPADEQDTNSWKKVFTPNLKFKPTLREKIMNFILKLLMGLNPPDEIDGNGIQRYEMKKPGKGYLDILYADENLRVTRGHKGALVVVERNQPTTSTD
jgi:hypothetical protein